MREKDGNRQEHTAEEGKDGIADTPAVSLKLNMGLPLVGERNNVKRDFKVLHKTNLTGIRENQNPPKMENLKTGASTGLPLVGYARISLV